MKKFEVTTKTTLYQTWRVISESFESAQIMKIDEWGEPFNEEFADMEVLEVEEVTQ